MGLGFALGGAFHAHDQLFALDVAVADVIELVEDARVSGDFADAEAVYVVLFVRIGCFTDEHAAELGAFNGYPGHAQYSGVVFKLHGDVLLGVVVQRCRTGGVWLRRAALGLKPVDNPRGGWRSPVAHRVALTRPCLAGLDCKSVIYE